ncbi:MAG TPA: hypothetical protein DCL21_05995 [Alphaproteobacteria bacterium]|nr:hypothetical protein [Alphaproteobacteria bacterium]
MMQGSLSYRSNTENNNNKKLSVLQQNNKELYGLALGFTKRRCSNNKRYNEIVSATIIKRSKHAEPSVKTYS